MNKPATRWRNAQQAIRLAALLPRPAPHGWEQRVTLVVTTYDRPGCIARFLQSARAIFAALDIVVCDVGRTPLFPDGTRLGPCMRWYTLPAGRGHAVGAARNHALAQVETPWFFLCDDDHVLGTHTHLERMAQTLAAHDLDVVGGCQGRDDYGAAVFVLHGRRLEQRFFWHHGRIAPGTVRCDRVSNTFLARTAAVRDVGWEERVHGDEHAEFFWRGKLAGLKVAQLAGTYVRHERQRETASHVWSRVLRGILDHPDRDYVRQRMGGDASVAQAARRAYCLEKNGLTAMVSRADVRDRRAFMRLMRDG